MNRARNHRYYLAASVALTTLLVYLPALRNEFVEWDDGQYVTENPHIRSFDGALFKWAFSTFQASNWHPLTWISHALDYALWGLNPLGHHLTSIILHSFSTFLVVLLAIKLVRAQRERTTLSPSIPGERSILIAAGVTGLLFGLHPLHVESVAWVAERKDLLCSFFFLISVMMYAKYAESQGSGVRGQESEGSGKEGSSQKSFLSKKYYIATLGFFVLALFSKPMAVSLPVVLLILDWHPFNRIASWKTLRPVLVEKIPFVALSLCSSIVTVLAQRAGSAMVSMELIPLPGRLCVAAESISAYLGKMLLPLNLVPFYPYPRVVSPFSLECLSAIALVVGLTTALLLAARKQKLWFAAWGYFVITLVPVLGIVQVGSQSMADRYAYLPSLGPFLAAGVAAAWMWEKTDGFTRWGRTIKIFSAAAGVFAVVALSSLTIAQIGQWKNGIDLWTYTIEKTPQKSPIMYSNRALAFKTKKRFDDAIRDYGMAISVDPSYFEAYNNRGILYAARGSLDNAIADFQKTIELNPASERAYFNLGIMYHGVGLFDKAIEQFTKCIEMNPKYSDYYVHRGIAYSSLGLYDRALVDLNKAIEVDRNSAVAYFNRANIYRRTGKEELAIPDFQKACGLGYDAGCNALRTFDQGQITE